MLSNIIIIIEFIIIIYAIYMINQARKNIRNSTPPNTSNVRYCVKQFMTSYEYRFYLILKNLENTYSIVPQLNLASVIKKTTPNTYYSELFRNIDFAIFTKDYQKLLLLIEINDSSHNRPDRIERDLKVREICNEAGIKIMTFYSNKPNNPNYVIKRIKNEITK